MSASKWFEQGREDGRWGSGYAPPTAKDGARALSEYNIGHHLGDKEAEFGDEYWKREGDASA